MHLNNIFYAPYLTIMWAASSWKFANVTRKYPHLYIIPTHSSLPAPILCVLIR